MASDIFFSLLNIHKIVILNTVLFPLKQYFKISDAEVYGTSSLKGYNSGFPHLLGILPWPPVWTTKCSICFNPKARTFLQNTRSLIWYKMHLGFSPRKPVHVLIWGLAENYLLQILLEFRSHLGCWDQRLGTVHCSPGPIKHHLKDWRRRRDTEWTRQDS